MPLGLGSALWGVILPKETTNLITNPSMEFGSTGWAALAGGATIGTTSYKQAFGVWSLQVNYAITSEGAFYNAGTPAAGSYTVSGFVNGSVGHRYRIVAESAGGAALGAGSITAAGGWQSVVASFGLASGTGLNIVARHIDSANGTFYLDGVQLESGTFQTTYIDGDQPGGTWTSAQHNSTSIRTNQYRGGGTLIALADLGLQVDQMPGVGMPPIEDSSQSYAVIDGAQFQRQRAASRHFSLTAKPIVGTSLGDFHNQRRTLIDVIKPDLVNPQQPIRFLYVGGQGTIQYDAYYESGLELGNMDGPIAENAAIKFAGYDPYWYFTYQQGTTLAPRVALGSVNWIAKRSSIGQWGSLGQTTGTTVNNQILTLAQNNGTLFIGGLFGSAAGTRARGIVQYFPSLNTFGTLDSGTVGGAVYSILPAPWGSILFAGSFGGVGGTEGARNWGQWNGAYGTLIGGTVEPGPIRTMALNPFGTLFLGGDFTTINGTANRFIARYFNNALGTLTSGSVDNTVESVLLDPTNRLYVGGLFTVANGTTANGMAQWTGLFGTVGSGVQAGGVTTVGAPFVAALALSPSQQLYVAGHFGSAGGGSAQHIASWNGVQYAPLGVGLGTTGSGISTPFGLLAGSSGDLYVGGVTLGTNSGPIPFPDTAFHWNGASWTPLDINLNGIGYVYSWARTPDGALYAGGSFAGTAQAASVATIINPGRAQAYPTMRLRNLSSGTARIYQLLNTLTNNNIYFNTVLQAGEQAVLNLQPGTRSFQSNIQGNMFGQILPGSNLATWSLLPGTNYVSFFSDNDSLEVAFFWQPRSWSIDGGTIQ